jgi:hypothetical protein
MDHGQDPQGEFRRADEDFVRAIELLDHPDLWKWRGDGRLRSARWADARGDFRGAIEGYRTATTYYRRAVELSPAYEAKIAPLLRGAMLRMSDLSK